MLRRRLTEVSQRRSRINRKSKKLKDDPETTRDKASAAMLIFPNLESKSRNIISEVSQRLPRTKRKSTELENDAQHPIP